MATVAKIRRPVLRYHGGKWKLAPWIIQHFPAHRVYVEPFGGGASVLLRKERSYAEVYGDLDGEIVNLFKVLRDDGDELVRLLRLTPFARTEYEESFEVSDDPIEQARRTVIRSFMGFGSNALCRNIQSGFRAASNNSGTTPAHDWTNFSGQVGFRSHTGPDRHVPAHDFSNYAGALLPICERMRGIVIESAEASSLIATHDSEKTLFYCDPPYVHDTRSTKVHGHHGYTHEMTDDQHRELAQVLHSVKGMVVISGYPCDLYDRELYAGWKRVERAALADGARKRTEVLWINPAAAGRLTQGELFGHGDQR